MKKVLSSLVAVAGLVVATTAMATIVGTPHDLSKNGTSAYKADNTTQVCVFCHTPHNSAVTRALWNRVNPTGTFSIYTSGANVDNTTWFVGGVKTLPASSPSLLCMSCHDGTTKMNALAVPPIAAAGGSGGHPALTGGATNAISGNANLGGSGLTNDHPISMIYNTVVAEALDAVTGAATLRAAVGGKVNGKLPLARNESLECNTCHNVHDYTFPPFLRMSNDNSALCVECHIK